MSPKRAMNAWITDSTLDITLTPSITIQMSSTGPFWSLLDAHHGVVNLLLSFFHVRDRMLIENGDLILIQVDDVTFQNTLSFYINVVLQNIHIFS